MSNGIGEFILEAINCVREELPVMMLKGAPGNNAASGPTVQSS